MAHLRGRKEGLCGRSALGGMDGRQLVSHSQMKPGLVLFVREMLLRAFVAVPFIRFVTAL